MSNGREVIILLFGLVMAAVILFAIAATTNIPELAQSAQNMGNVAIIGFVLVIIVIIAFAIMFLFSRR